ncbi:MAG: type VI secretion system protein TssA [Alphaproteobacteria bacterium]|nr:MAG: type VI secretion system protein TssA [Alphaproteobacteria bacterium]
MTDLNYALLLKPLSEKKPSGEDIRHGDEYDVIQEARREDDPTLPQGVWKIELKRADWTKIIHLCSQILAEKSKDLQVASWLMEAAIKKDGLRGLSAGLKVFGMIFDMFWDSFFPNMKDGDIDARLAVLDWVNEKIPERMYELSIAEKLEESDTFTFGEWTIVSANQKVEGNRVRLKRLRTAISRTNPVVYQAFQKDLESAQKTLAQLDALMGEKHQQTQGSLYKLKRVLSDFGSFIDEVIRDICPIPHKAIPHEKTDKSTTILCDSSLSDKQTPQSDTHSDSGSEATPLAHHSGPLMSRKDAYKQLANVVAYFSAYEPHNPGHYLLRKVMSWSDLDLGEIMKEIMQYPQFYQNTFEQFGAKQGKTLAPQVSHTPNPGVTPSGEERAFPQGEFYPIQPKSSHAQYQRQYDALRQFGDGNPPVETPPLSSKRGS